MKKEKKLLALENRISQNILKNVGSIFTGAYLHYKNVPKETMFERNIADI